MGIGEKYRMGGGGSQYLFGFGALGLVAFGFLREANTGFL